MSLLTLSPHDPLALQRPDLVADGHFIDGRWQASAGAPLVVTDPSTGQAIARVPDASAAEARAAADAAHRAFAGWRETPTAARAQWLRGWHAAVLAHQDDLARLISLEQGKPQPEARAEVLYAAAYIEWFAAQCWRGHGEVLAAPSPRHRLSTVLEPVGPVAAITPWNFPAAMLARKVAPALAAGCTVVTKPAEDTPLTAMALMRLAHEAGLPPGVLNLVLASRGRAAEVVDVWLADERVRKLTFTGSTGVGRHLAQASAATLKRLSLELGGNAPFIVFADADLDAAADGLLRAKFRNAGQTCVSPNRLLVERPVYQAFLGRLAERIAALKVGPARQANSQVGPLINAAAVAKAQRHIDDARQQGARVVLGGHALAGPGHFFAPTLLADVHDGMACACDETFGPVAAVSPFDDEAEALRRANGTPYGLAAYFYSRDAARCHRVAARLEAGMVGINETVISHAHAPFGGIKASGQGREGSELGLHDYQQVKLLCEGGL